MSDEPTISIAKFDSSASFWYLAVSKPKQEARAVENLANQDIQAFCPIVKVEKLLRGRRVIIEEALFTGYVFVNISEHSSLWHKIRSTRGIKNWVKFAGSVAKLPNALVENLIEASSSTEHKIVISHFNKGQKINILSGPFSGLSAVFEKDDGEKRSLILVEFLGQENRLAVLNEQISTNY